MKVIHGLTSLNRCKKRCAVSIGNFDGFHKGHQKLINHIISESKKRSLCSTIITLEPLPEEFFKDKKFKRLTRLKEKLKILDENKIEQVICLNFNSQFSRISAIDFISNNLINNLDTRYLVIGEDFKFGFERKGNYKLLQDCSTKTNMEVISIESLMLNDKKISCSEIRKALEEGDSRGYRLGYPTANIDIYKSYPINGIFVVQILMENNENHFGLASLGNKPTFSGKNNILEAYIFNFDKNIYNEKLKISFITKLRDQIKFKNENELIQQMDLDYKNALQFLEDRSYEV